jgi:DNA repair protein RadC
MNEPILSTPMMQTIDEAKRTGANRFRSKAQPQEWGLIALRECPVPVEQLECTSSSHAASYWNTHVRSHPYFNPEVECFVVLLLNVRRKIKGHVLVSMGIADSVIIHPRETFRAAIIASAHSIIIMHNHPSGEPNPSEADLRITRELVRSGQVLRIEVLDHVIVGNNNHVSLRELGYFR